MRRPEILMVKLGNKKFIRSYCCICGADIFKLKTKEALCKECEDRMSNKESKKSTKKRLIKPIGKLRKVRFKAK